MHCVPLAWVSTLQLPSLPLHHVGMPQFQSPGWPAASYGQLLWSKVSSSKQASRRQAHPDIPLLCPGFPSHQVSNASELPPTPHGRSWSSPQWHPIGQGQVRSARSFGEPDIFCLDISMDDSETVQMDQGGKDSKQDLRSCVPWRSCEILGVAGGIGGRGTLVFKLQGGARKRLIFIFPDLRLPDWAWNGFRPQPFACWWTWV